MPLDIEVINRKILLIEKDFRKLKKISRLSFAEYQKNSDYEILAERYLERIIGRLLDINYHILGAKNKIVPEDYYRSFIYMGENGYLTTELAKSMANSAGLRNRLAHEYDEIDVKKIYCALQAAVTEVPKYLKSVYPLVEKKSAQRKMF